MPKHEFGTPKDIAKRMKARGLQKLRWYCQMCQKQCRDENGFKCHTMSESHQRQLLLFAENPGKYLGEFSREFEKGFLDLVRRRFATKRVHANQVYQEYISDRHHLHMNATSWVTLSGFVKYLGRTGKCHVDQTEKGWYIRYIERDPDTIARQERLAKKEKMEKDDEERLHEFIEKQVEKAKSLCKEEKELEFTELLRESQDERIKLDLNLSSVPKIEKITPSSESQPKVNLFDNSKINKNQVKNNKEKSTENKKRKSTALDDIIKYQEISKEKQNRKDHWLVSGVVVKIITKSLGDKYYKQKGVVKEVIDNYACTVRMLECGHLLKLDQEHLETVIPAIGRLIYVVNGAYRDCTAILKGIDQDKFCAVIEIASGLTKGRIIKGISYDDICKLHIDKS